MTTFPGFALGIVTAKAAAYAGPKDLRGLKIGVTPDAGPGYILNSDGTSCYGSTGGAYNALETDFAASPGKTRLTNDSGTSQTPRLTRTGASSTTGFPLADWNTRWAAIRRIVRGAAKDLLIGLSGIVSGRTAQSVYSMQRAGNVVPTGARLIH